jgi:hypothetical protein
LLVGMVDSKVLDRAELQRLADRIAQAQQTAPPAKAASASKAHPARGNPSTDRMKEKT